MKVATSSAAPLNCFYLVDVEVVERMEAGFIAGQSRDEIERNLDKWDANWRKRVAKIENIGDAP